MKKNFFLVFLACFLLLSLSAQQPEGNADPVFSIVEEYPRWYGCETEADEQSALDCFNRKMGEFLRDNIKYPPKAKKKDIQGKVFVEFVIEKDGSVSNVKVLRGIGYGCDEEVVRVVKLFPRFQPAVQRGKKVRMIYRLPVQFKLS